MVDSTHKLALVFPGQGCQYVGMGADLNHAFPEARAVFERADAVLGFSLSGMCFTGPEEALNETANTQPAIFTTTLALWRALAPRLQAILPRVGALAGHSLGEYTALAVAGALDWEDALRLVRRRGEAMGAAGRTAPGGMAALIGLEDAVVAEIVAAGEGVWIANYNSPGQVVIAGQRDALERALRGARERGARRVVPLPVSVAAHTPLMRAAAEELRVALEQTPFRRPWAPVVSNALAAPLAEPEAIRGALLEQLTAPVRWVESIQGMAARGVTALLEVGPRSVVSGLIKRIIPAATCTSVTDVASLNALDVEVFAA